MKKSLVIGLVFLTSLIVYIIKDNKQVETRPDKSSAPASKAKTNTDIFKELSIKKTKKMVRTNQKSQLLSYEQKIEIIKSCNSYLKDRQNPFESIINFLDTKCTSVSDIPSAEKQKVFLKWLEFVEILKDNYSKFNPKQKKELGENIKTHLKYSKTSIQISVLSHYLAKYLDEIKSNYFLDLNQLNEEYQKELDLITQDYKKIETNSPEGILRNNKERKLGQYYVRRFKEIFY